MNQAASIGIIGGADGPTAIFVTSSIGTEWILPALVLGCIGVWLIWRKRKQ